MSSIEKSWKEKSELESIADLFNKLAKGLPRNNSLAGLERKYMKTSKCIDKLMEDISPKKGFRTGVGKVGENVVLIEQQMLGENPILEQIRVLLTDGIQVRLIADRDFILRNRGITVCVIKDSTEDNTRISISNTEEKTTRTEKNCTAHRYAQNALNIVQKVEKMEFIDIRL